MNRNVAVRAFDAALAHHWAMSEEPLRALFEIAAREPGPALEALAAKHDRPLDNTQRTTMRDGVAVVPVMGPLFRYANIFTELSGATSLDMLSTDFHAALNDPSVRAIVALIDSPGGEVNGVAEMAQAVMAARGRKPIVAHVGHLCCSGAYWIASAADKVMVAPTALVGSIGAVLTVRDTRAADEKRGIRTLEFVSSVSPDKHRDPASDEGKAKLQAIVDRLGEEFVSAVARQRGVSVERVLSDFGQGGVLVGADAVKARMADGISTLEGVIASLVSAAPPAGGAARMSNPRAAAAATSENRSMDIKTVADLKAAFPDLVAQLEGAATDTATRANETAVAAARAAGAKAENARIVGIQPHAKLGHPDIISAAIADPTCTPDMAAGRILAAETKLRENQMAGITGVEQLAAGVTPAPAAQRQDGGSAVVAPKLGEQRSADSYKADWEKSRELQRQHETAAAYANYATGVALGRIRVLERKAG